MIKSNYKYTIVLRPEKEGGFTVMVPALSGCVTYGKTLEEAKTMADDAIRGYLESMKKHGEPISSEEDFFVSTLNLNHA